MNRSRATRVVVAAGLVVAALAVSGCRSGQVTYVVDGDTLDVDGITGGFNFQHCWSSGWLAGQAIAAAAS